MKPLVYREPADAAGNFHEWLNKLRNRSGAYVIRSRENRQVLYVGESHTGNLAKTIKRHFHAWTIGLWFSDTFGGKTYERESVEIAVRLTPPGAPAIGAQNNLIRSLGPRDNILGQPSENPF